MPGHKAASFVLLASLTWLVPQYSEALAGSQVESSSEPEGSASGSQEISQEITQEIVVAPGQAIEMAAPDNATLEVALGGGAMTPIEQSVTAPSTEGDSWLVAISRNAAGVASVPLWVKVRVDATGPKLDLVFEPEPVASGGKRWLPPGIEAAVVASDPIAGVESSWIEAGSERRTGEGRASSPLPLVTGRVGLEAGAVDRVGNVASPMAVEIWVDADAPKGEIEIEAPQVTINGRIVVPPEVSIDDSISDAESGLETVQRILDGAAVTDARTWGSPAGKPEGRLSAGEHRAEATARDRVGNQTTLSLDFVVDDRGPGLLWTPSARRSVEREGTTYFTPPVRIEVSAEDDLAGTAELSWSRGDAWTAWTGPLEVLGESLRLRARDRVGNESLLEATWHIDDEPPQLVLVDEDGGLHVPDSTVDITRGQSVSVEAADDGSGVDEVLTSWRHVGWFRLASFSARQEISESGRYFVYARAVDRLGNETKARWLVRAR